LFLAILGTGALVLASRATARPLTAISSINPAMNFAYVRLQGVVIDYPSLSTADGYLSFRLQDTTDPLGGEMRVSAYRAAVETLLAQQRVPMPGDQVTVEGTLRVRDDEPSLVLNAPEALEISSPQPQTIDLAALDAMALGERACTRGQVRRLRDVSESLRIVTLRDGSAEADMLLPLGLQPLFGDAPELEVGEWISASGAVGEYRGQRQLLPVRAADIVPAFGQQPDIRPISALNRDLLGQWVAVRGQVDKLRPVNGGMLIDLREHEDAITVVMFDAWFGVPFSETLDIGDMLVAQGELVDYHGKLEIQPELSVDVVKLVNVKEEE
jgi:DNA/RNA endonuclease YhcR with UshA esterase domain